MHSWRDHFKSKPEHMKFFAWLKKQSKRQDLIGALAREFDVMFEPTDFTNMAHFVGEAEKFWGEDGVHCIADAFKEFSFHIRSKH